MLWIEPSLWIMRYSSEGDCPFTRLVVILFINKSISSGWSILRIDSGLLSWVSGSISKTWNISFDHFTVFETISHSKLPICAIRWASARFDSLLRSMSSASLRSVTSTITVRKNWFPWLSIISPEKSPMSFLPDLVTISSSRLCNRPVFSNSSEASLCFSDSMKRPKSSAVFPINSSLE